MTDEIDVSAVKNPLDAWAELEPLYRSLHQHHEPIRGFTLQDGWQLAQQTVIAAQDDRLVLIARAQGKAIGMLDGAVRVNPITGVRSGYINNAYVETAWRRSGVARRMLASFEEWARAKGATESRLNVDSANEVGVEVWLVLGFGTVSLTMARTLD